ncbi:MAG: hypothetical protein Q8M11_07295 [Sulfuritalea sp.]|nr:hypothetical protein [Sulfuritalea sp.]MDP1983204.1 hypothetical protein [Sulfuritalea sp.]
MALSFLGAALGVEGNRAFEDGLLVRGLADEVGPAVGVEHGVVERDADQLVVRGNRAVEKLKDAALGGIDCGNLTRQPAKRRPEVDAALMMPGL